MLDSFFEKAKPYAPALIRYGVGIVFFLFGFDQLRRPEAWIAYFPTALPFGLNVSQAVFYNGIFDLVIGALLILGILVRLVALIGALHLIGVMWTLGYSDIAIRDFGLFLGCLSVLLYGADRLSLSRKIWKK